MPVDQRTTEQVSTLVNSRTGTQDSSSSLVASTFIHLDISDVYLIFKIVRWNDTLNFLYSAW